MFILKLGAEALSLKSNIDGRQKEVHSSGSSTSNLESSAPSPVSDSSTTVLESLLTRGLAESALLPLETVVRRSQSVHSHSRSGFLQELERNSNDKAPIVLLDATPAQPVFTMHRPRSDTVPETILSSVRRDKSAFIDLLLNKQRYKPYSRPQPPTSCILYQHLSKQHQSHQTSTASHISINDSSSSHLTSQSHPAEEDQLKQLISTEETKYLRKELNNLLKTIMTIIKEYSSYTVVTDKRQLDFVSQLWFRIIVLLLIQLDPAHRRSLFRLILLSLFNRKDRPTKRRQQIVLLEKLQDLISGFHWMKFNTDAFNSVLFWFFAKYGHPDVFCLSQDTVILKLQTVLSDPAQREATFELISSLYELHEDSVRALFCQHLPADTTVADFLLQWT